VIASPSFLKPTEAASGRGCVKTQERPLEVNFRLGDFSVKVSRLLAGRYRLLSQLVASNDVFERDFWGEIVVTFSHSLGRKRSIDSAYFGLIE
jgi:hypothetical protein